jgi:hypothetical protein
MRLLRGLLGATYVTALVVLFGSIGLLLAATAPGALGYESYVVNAASPQSGLKRGDLGVVAPVPAALLAPGDVIIYRTPEDPATVLTRRVASMAPGPNATFMVQTDPDATSATQPVTVSEHATLGRLVYALPRLGTLVEQANQPLGRALFFGIPGVLLASDALRKRLRGAAHRVEVQAEPRAVDMRRVQALVETGRRALDAGYPDLALRAADGALALVPGNAAAWHVKAGALAALKAGLEHVAA